MASLLSTCIINRLSILRFNPKPLFIPHNQSKGWEFLINLEQPIFWNFNFVTQFCFLACYYHFTRRFLISSSMASGPKENPSNNPGLHVTPDEATKGYIMQQTVCHYVYICAFLILVIVSNMCDYWGKFFSYAA